MERWLSKAGVLLGLCGVLLIATFNRRDPMVFFMFLFLAACTVLGMVIPWLSLRGTVLRLGTTGDVGVTEGAGSDLQLQLERRSRWPAFMVEVETEWEWASRRIVLRQTMAVVRRGSTAAAAAQPVVFPCRGRYQLVAVRLSSGFPLGLVRAHSRMVVPPLCVQVFPKPQLLRWPLAWRVASDPMGAHTTRHTGPSLDLGHMRPYEPGDAVGRVSWHASARAGELIIQHFQQPGRVRLHLVLSPPARPALGDPRSAGEQAVRLAAGVCGQAHANGVHVMLHLPDREQAWCDAQAACSALATALPGDFAQSVAQMAAQVRPGDQVAVVVPGDMPGPALQQALKPLQRLDCAVVVCIAMAPVRHAPHDAKALELRLAAEHAGFACAMEAP